MRPVPHPERIIDKVDAPRLIARTNRLPAKSRTKANEHIDTQHRDCTIADMRLATNLITLDHLWHLTKQRRGIEICLPSAKSVAEGRSPARASSSHGFGPAFLDRSPEWDLSAPVSMV
jgi:hypothetical protein